MNPEVVLAVLPDNKGEAKSLKEIALAMGLDISTRSLARVLRTPIK